MRGPAARLLDTILNRASVHATTRNIFRSYSGYVMCGLKRGYDASRLTSMMVSKVILGRDILPGRSMGIGAPEEG